MKIQLTPCKPQGAVRAPASKSFAHRLLICAALAATPCILTISYKNDDLEATARCLTALGVRIEKIGEQWSVTPTETWNDNVVLDCGESGSTLRFLLPVVASRGVATTFTGHGRLPERPNDALLNVMRDHGVTIADGFPIRISGRLLPGSYFIRGDVSSQYVTGLLFALSHLTQTSEINLIPPVASAPYLDITTTVLAQYGADIQREGNRFTVSPAALQGGAFSAEGDWSNAAALLACGMTVCGLNETSVQGDRAFLAVAESLGAAVINENGCIHLNLDHLHGAEIDAQMIPDLVPVLAAMAATADGTTRIFNAQRLRYKESDRLRSTAAMLCALGGDVSETDDGLIIRGKPYLQGGEVDSANDHRIVMAAAVAAQKSKIPVVIQHAQAINKSFPAFFGLYRTQGGAADVL